MSVPSPCNDVCRMHTTTGWCEGCARTLAEIESWSRLDDAARQRIWTLLPARRAKLEQWLNLTPRPPAA